jgi:hypothetical protein
MISLTLRSAAIAAVTAVTASCSTLTDPDDRWRRQAGLIDIGSNQPTPIELPDTIQGTGPRSVVVRTWGSSSCTRPAGADVEQGDDYTAVIRPYDRVAIRGICTDDLAPHPRDVEIVFDRAGTWSVRVIGRGPDGEEAVFEAPVVVRSTP